MTVQVRLPPAGWIPKPSALYEIADLLLSTVGAALDQDGGGADYEAAQRRIVLGEPVWHPQVGAQLVVACLRAHVGKAGQEQFQYSDGAFGRLAFRTAIFQVDLVRAWPKPQGGVSPRLPQGVDLEGAAEVLFRDALVGWAALLALSLGGITPVAAPVFPDQILVGPLQSVGPHGALGGFSIEVQVQL